MGAMVGVSEYGCDSGCGCTCWGGTQGVLGEVSCLRDRVCGGD